MLPVTNAGTSTDCPVKKTLADEARGMLSHTRRIIPVSKWLITMVSKSPK